MQYFFRASHGRFQYDDGNLLLAGDDVELANHLLVVAPKPIQTSHHHRVAARKPSHYITILEEASEVSLYTIFRRATMPMDTLQHRLMVPCRGGIGMETWEAVARRIRQLCREQGITPNKLSKISGVPQATVKGTSETVHLAGNWSDRNVFMGFLSAYLEDRAEHVSLDGTPCEAGVVAAIYRKDGQDFLVVPFKTMLPAYNDYIGTFGHSECWASDAEFYRSAKNWGIKGFKVGSRNDDPWRHAFYKTDGKPLNCLGIPVSELSEDVRGIIEQAKAAHNVDEEVL